MSTIRVLIIADDPLARAGLATLLGEFPDLIIAGRISGSDDLWAAAQTYRPDVLLWDMGWKPETALARLSDAPKEALILALLDDVSTAAQAWRAGVHGLLKRDSPPSTIAMALSAAARKLLVIDPAYAAVLSTPERSELPPAQFPGDEAPLVEELTPRELEVLRLVAEGLPNKSIAQRLEISEHTVKFHVNALLGKLGVTSRTEAVVRATRLGLIFL